MELENKLEEYSKHEKNFKKTFVNVVGVHVPRKTKVLRGNHPAGKYWSPGRPEDVPLQRPQNVP